jgi:cytochrome c biogenesis protein CcdA
MLQLILVIAPIALLDSTSIIPVCLVPLAKLLASRRPILGAGALVAGVYITYLLCGILIYFGLRGVFEQLSGFLHKWWHNPDAGDFALQIVLGLALMIVGWRISAPPRPKKTREISSEASPIGAFLFGAGLTVIGMPGALPFFAAVDQMLRADLPAFQNVVAIATYCLIFVAPLFGIILIRVLLADRADAILGAVNRFLDTWGKGVIIVLLILLGLALTVDGIWFFVAGKPLFPTPAG